MNSESILAGHLTNKSKALGYIILFPSYLLYIPKIASFLLIVYANHVTNANTNMLTVYLNLMVGIGSLVMAVLFFKDFIIDNIQAFKKRVFEDSIWAGSIGIGTLYLVAIVSGIVVNFLLDLFGYGRVDSANQQAVNSLISNAPLLMMLQAVIIAPIVEELLYRGLLFRSIYNHNRLLAHVISAFLFGFSHVYSGLLAGDASQWIHLISYVAMGAVFGLAYEKRKNICVPILVHMLNNLIATLLSILMK